MRALWKEGKVISLKLRKDLYSLAQMLKSPYMRFYGIFKAKDEWEGTDLNEVDAVFCATVGNVVIQHLGVRSVPPTEATPSIAPFERYFIRPRDNSEGYRLRDEYMWRGGSLVDIEAGKGGSSRAPPVIQDLTVKEHRALILKHELTSMYGDKDVTERLLRFHKTGVNSDPMKEMVFPGLASRK